VKRLGAVALVVASATSMVACGGSSRAIDPRGAQLLEAEVALARQAVATGDLNRASTLLRAVEDTVGGLRAQRKISDRRAAEVLVALGDVEDSLRTWVSTSTTVAVPPPTFAPSTFAPSTMPAPAAPVAQPHGPNKHGHHKQKDDG
jgi:hypothetical protein